MTARCNSMWLTLVFTCLACVSTLAQTTGATLQGTIADAQGGVLPGASVTITGQNFRTATSVKFNGVNAGFSIESGFGALLLVDVNRLKCNAMNGTCAHIDERSSRHDDPDWRAVLVKKAPF